MMKLCYNKFCDTDIYFKNKKIFKSLAKLSNWLFLNLSHFPQFETKMARSQTNFSKKKKPKENLTENHIALIYF